MLTGQPPFQAETPLDTVLQVIHGEVVPLRRLQPKLPRDQGEHARLAFSADGKRLAAASWVSRAVMIWERVHGGELREIPHAIGQGDWCDVAFSPDRRFLALAEGSGLRIQIWSKDGRKLLHQLTRHTNAVRCLAFSTMAA